MIALLEDPVPVVTRHQGKDQYHKKGQPREKDQRLHDKHPLLYRSVAQTAKPYEEKGSCGTTEGPFPTVPQDQAIARVPAANTAPRPEVQMAAVIEQIVVLVVHHQSATPRATHGALLG